MTITINFRQGIRIMRTLNVFDFDETITKISTNKDPFLTPEENTKEGLKHLIKHNENQLTAIATYNDYADGIVDYLLPLLDIKTDQVSKLDSITNETYKLHQYSLGNELPPLIIATIDCRKGKNAALEEISKRLPECDEYHFFDDDSFHISQALKLNRYHCHKVVPNASSFEIDERETVKARLEYYKTKLSSNSFHAFNEVSAIQALIKSLNNKEDLDSNHLKTLKKEELNKIITTWEPKYYKKLEPLTTTDHILSII